MAVTIGMQNIIQFVGAMIAVAIILNVLVPGTDGFIPEATFAGIYIGSALIIAVFVIVWAVLAPKRVTDRHAVDTETETTKVPAASH
jgi:hypothetical protein